MTDLLILLAFASLFLLALVGLTGILGLLAFVSPRFSRFLDERIGQPSVWDE